MKRAAKLVAAILATAMLGGCIPHTELDERAIILAIAIDYEEEEYNVTFQYYNPTGLGGQAPVDNSQPNVLTASGKGMDVYEALEDASFKCGRELLLGVAQIILIGEDAANHSVTDVMDFSKSCFQSHPYMLVAVTEGKAEDYMQVKFSEGIASTHKLKYLLQNADRYGMVSLPTALDLFVALRTEQQSACLPRLKLNEDEKSDASEDGKSIEISGGVLIMGGKAQDTEDMETMKGLQLLGGRIDETTLTFEQEDDIVSVGLIGMQRKITPVFEEGKLIFQVKLTCGGRYFTAPSGVGLTEDKETVQKCEEQLKSIMQTAAENTVIKYGADPINLERTVRHRDYKMWQQVKDNWEELLKECEFVFDIEVKIDRLSLAVDD
ncbi:MAG: Ger(x)C family spore germination protein [Oscillospiraceae bacterium]|nr:Ger(x)C family spore germination protein [Oscillospiraceae bacterium]